MIVLLFVLSLRFLFAVKENERVLCRHSLLYHCLATRFTIRGLLSNELDIFLAPISIQSLRLTCSVGSQPLPRSSTSTVLSTAAFRRGRCILQLLLLRSLKQISLLLQEFVLFTHLIVLCIEQVAKLLVLILGADKA